ncbi:MAG TPA: ABC transporter ATP-binding protein [Thermomicrobiaceae bacterium]|nr:ABC transporter ATP-binding protein [Thermomicrobiaceae bacterium]
MSDERYAVEFHNVSRRFTLRHERHASFQDWFIGLLRTRGVAEEFWALRQVSFGVRPGEALGVLGRNGAGKSTLLKLVTRILEPTSGEIRLHGRVHAMLELGAGFHPELSGRDNVYLNGSIYGFSRRRMRERLDEIVAFAELERFIDTPVKHYSSGMFMRLGFAIAIHMEPDILVMDEILAVGDAVFQEKCYDALLNLKRQGKTILFVSHDASKVRGFCDRALLLQAGQLIDLGPTGEVVDHYERLMHGEEREASLLRVRPVDAEGAPREYLFPGDDLTVEVLLRPGAAPPGELLLALDLFDSQGGHLFGSTGVLPGCGDPDGVNGSRAARLRLRELPLAEGVLAIVATLQRAEDGGAPRTLDRREAEVQVLPRHRPSRRGLLELAHEWEWERTGVGEDTGGALGPGALPTSVPLRREE